MAKFHFIYDILIFYGNNQYKLYFTLLSVSLAQREIPSNLDKLAKGTPAFTILSVWVSVLQQKINWQDQILNISATTGPILLKFEM